MKSTIATGRRRIAPGTGLLVAALLVVVQVMPQVDLPDTIFQRDPTPTIAKSRAVTPLAHAVAISVTLLAPFRAARELQREGAAVPPHPVNRSLSLLFSALLC